MNASSIKAKIRQDDKTYDNRNDKTIETNLQRVGSNEVLDFEGSQLSSVERLSMNAMDQVSAIKAKKIKDEPSRNLDADKDFFSNTRNDIDGAHASTPAMDQRTGFNSQGNLQLVNEINAASSCGEL